MKMKRNLLLAFGCALSLSLLGNVYACSSTSCDENSDCNGYANNCTAKNGASCKGEVDEDYTKSGTQGCNGACVCNPA